MKKLVARVEMLIHKPARRVFDAFVKPRLIEKFWLKKTSGPLGKDVTVRWQFMVEGASETAKVTAFEEDELIVFDWSDGVSVSLKFTPHGKGSTTLSIEASGFHGRGLLAQALNATEGFSIVACDLKSLLETGQSGNMVRDKAVLVGASKTDA
ncbi:MAG: SRPBCC domain-containing protein [Polaromonas sp.]|uniref:SRPBCC domain-containing protein n=1 Tax=Polaromonas sp. TaxID=1869339 RepID=UPI0017F0FEF7|nr:SRPBCC domain-containing protein [Polaromonas sp.]MBA3595741.1 SRPBCC domain-containing protein [Polaromonas sp.]